MKKVVLTLLLLSIIFIPTNSYCDFFTVREPLCNGECDLYKKFKVKKGEIVTLNIKSKASGAITFYILDEEDNVVLYDATTIKSAAQKTQIKKVDLNLKPGKYYICARGKTIKAWPCDYIQKTNGYFKLKLKSHKHKLCF
ncbi:cupredoxin domain-containing protein [Romboutsia hominis]|uniref:cupredoxin domain-containing protein n=1 Tax=Romboutsia hominis TaxID=1507512 RepID=UPI001F05865F|nr:cupredoxin domain-containing protein [Romboutsia hominis]MCH1959700.1 cupredoxin domain-containing protein [Romboutsia hominis]MCH1969877.1 cupredoxin domain-containing protein [Romboutsia hominis]